MPSVGCGSEKQIIAGLGSRDREAPIPAFPPPRGVPLGSDPALPFMAKLADGRMGWEANIRT